MNISALDNCMFQLSSSEKKYMSGKHSDSWSSMPTKKINGKDVYYLSNLPDTYNESYLTKNTLLCDHNLRIKRNSRYNEVPEHVHSYVEMNYVYSGKCPQTINGNKIVLKKNQVLLIDTDCPHSIDRLETEDIMVSIMISKDFLKNHMFHEFSKDSILSNFFINAINEQTSHDHYLLFHSENDRRISLFFQEFFCECFDPSINSTDIVYHLFYIIMAQLINVYENDMTNHTIFTKNAPIVPIIRYIESNYRTCTQKSVADFFHISSNYVSLLLKKYTGMNYIQLVQEKRISYAAKLLKTTNDPITVIASKAGYENMSFFYKKFNEKYKCSPKEYKEHTIL